MDASHQGYQGTVVRWESLLARSMQAGWQMWYVDWQVKLHEPLDEAPGPHCSTIVWICVAHLQGDATNTMKLKRKGSHDSSVGVC